MSITAKILQAYLEDVILNPESAVLEIDTLPEEFQELGETLVYFSKCITETTILAKEITKGNLNVNLPSSGNEMAAPLKSLHAALRHLTWQTQQVAKGDYNQKVEFMGDFSNAFNKMIEQLEQRRLNLLGQIHAMSENKSIYEMLVGQINQQIIVTTEDTSSYLFASHEICQKNWRQLRTWLGERITEINQTKTKIVTEIELESDGEMKNYAVSIHLLRWNQKNAYAFVFTDISLEKEQLKKLENIANIDTLTQLYSRRYGMETLNEWIAQKKKFILCFIDMDNLKFVNDTYGHMEGDDYIISVAQKISIFDNKAVVCRIGGDEFMLLAENLNQSLAAERFESLRNELLHTSSLYERSISYGIISVDENNNMQTSDLLSLADERMYEYKRAYKLKFKHRKMLKENV